MDTRSTTSETADITHERTSRPARHRIDPDPFDWGDERTLQEKVQQGDVQVSAIDIGGVVLLGMIAPASCLGAMGCSPWWMAPGLGAAAGASFLVALRAATQVRLLSQIDVLIRRAGSLRSRFRRRGAW